MVIAVNTKRFLKAYQQDYFFFIYNTFVKIANQHPQHTFLFFSDTTFGPSFNFSKNSIPVSIVPTIRMRSFSIIFYYVKIAFLLKKHKATVFINADIFISLFTKVPQCFILHNPSNVPGEKSSFLYKTYLLSALKKIKIIITESQFSKNYITRRYKTNEQNCDVIFNSAGDVYAPPEWEEKEKIKATYADENEYFVFFGDTSQLNNLLNLLKAFSHFKKWQKSAMQLLIIKSGTMPKAFTESLTSFKYRKDVKLLYNLPADECTKVVLASYAGIYFPSFENFSFAASRVVRLNIPIITTDKGAMPEIFGEAAVYVNFNDPVKISEQLILLFKDEQLRKDLIEKGKTTVEKYSWEKITGLLWQSILKASS